MSTTDDKEAPQGQVKDLLDTVRAVSEDADRWFVSFARHLGRASRMTKVTTAILVESASAAAETTKIVAKRMASNLRSRRAQPPAQPAPHEAAAEAPASDEVATPPPKASSEAASLAAAKPNDEGGAMVRALVREVISATEDQPGREQAEAAGEPRRASPVAGTPGDQPTAATRVPASDRPRAAPGGRRLP